MRPDAPLDRVRVHLNAAVIEECGQARPVADRVAHRLRQLRGPRHPADMCVQPAMQRPDDRSTTLLTDPLTVFGWMAADLGVYRIQRGDTRQHLRRKWRLRRRIELEERASHVDPAERQTDRLIAPITGQALEAIVAVNLQSAFEAGQMFGWPQVLAIITVDVGDRRMRRPAPR